MKNYNVAVGNRMFGTYKTKDAAIGVAQAASEIYRDKRCAIVHNNWKEFKNCAWMNGEKVK